MRISGDRRAYLETVSRWLAPGIGSVSIGQDAARQCARLAIYLIPRRRACLYLAHSFAKLGHPAGIHIGFPFVEQRPVNGAGAEIGHVLVLREPVDGFLQDTIVAAKNGAMTGKEVLRVVVENAFERIDELRDVGAVVRVD